MKTPHKHHDLIVQWAKDTTQVVECFNGRGWVSALHPLIWLETGKYRIRHKHQDLIDQKAARPELIVEFLHSNGNWYIANFMWWPNIEYRLVEPAKKKVKMWQWVCEDFSGVPFVTMSFYKAPDEVRGKIIQRADWTEIEVEE